MTVACEIDSDRFVTTARRPAAAVFCFPRGRMVGRNRKDAPRKPCGRLVEADLGEPSTLEQRRVLVGDAATNPKAGYPLGILCLRGALTPVDYRAGMKFSGLYAAVWGKGAIRSHLETVVYGLKGKNFSELEEIDREKRMIDLADQLGQATAVLLAL